MEFNHEAERIKAAAAAASKEFVDGTEELKRQSDNLSLVYQQTMKNIQDQCSHGETRRVGAGGWAWVQCSWCGANMTNIWDLRRTQTLGKLVEPSLPEYERTNATV